MKLIYVELVVLVYALQIFIGSSHGLPNALTCSPKDYYNSTTEECEPKCQWVDYTAELENDPRLVWLIDSKTQAVIIRKVQDDDDVVVLSRYINYLKDVPTYVIDTPPYYKEFEVLLAERDYCDWQPSSNGNIFQHAIEAGQNENKTIYVCRFTYHGDDFAGMVDRDNSICYSNFKVKNATYDLLVYINE